MDFGSKLEDLNLTRDEMSRLGAALKDETFRELLREYAAEISSPENRRKYEEEISELEQQRGVRARFIHPEPHHVLKTRSARGKLFINICSNPLIDKPSSEAARDRRGTPGLRWRIPYSLTPARPDRDAAGNSCVTHDVIFHPDALHLAGNSRRFMKLLHSTALGGIQDSFHVELDTHNIKQLQMKYKGVPQAALIRRPIPGHQQNTGEDLLLFPYPDQSQTEPEPSQTEPEPDQSNTESDPGQTQTEPEPDQSQTEPDPDQTHTEPEPDQSQTEPEPSQTEPEPDQTEPEPDQSNTESDPGQTQTEPEPDQRQTEPDPDQTHTEPDSRPPSSHRPTAPQYSVKYRSVVDLQDYRNSRDSGPGTRPTEIIITVDLPLLRSAGDAELIVKQRRLVLESQNRAYKLDLPLSYPVDEDKGHAQFNKTKKQLTVTLPVRPVTSTGFQRITCDETKSSNEDEEDEADRGPNEDVPEPKSDKSSTLTRSAELQPSASELQITDLTTEPQMLGDPAVNRTEPQTLGDPAVNRTEPQEPDHQICSVEVDKDETNINQPVDQSSNTFSSESEITASGGDEVSSASETENTQESESNTARNQPLMTEINPHHSSSTEQHPDHDEQQSSAQDPEEPQTRRSSEDHESTAEHRVILREMEIFPHKTSSAVCFQNSLWAELD